MFPLRRLAAPAAVFLATLGLAGTAHAAAPGVNVSAYADAVNPALADAQQIRFFVPWRNFEPGGADDFTKNGPKGGPPSPLVTDLKLYVDLVRLLGKTPIIVVLDAPDWASGGGTAHKHPRASAEYAAFAGELAAWLGKSKGPAPVYEIWNEPDAAAFWGGAPDAAFYTRMLKESYVAIKNGDPSATVLTGPTTGNNYAWIEALYANGAKGFFDGVSVHTDTACSIVGPDVFYRAPNGRLGQYTFLGYREVRASMLANGDDKPIWMTEIGWGTTSAVCASGESAGKKLAGVSESDQAAFLTKGFACMANDPYVVAATWFTLRDDASNRDEPNHYGLLRDDGSAKPALAAFAGARGQGAGECGDFTPPALSVTSPTAGQRFVDKLDLKASATDGGVGVARISYAYDGGKEIRNFTDTLTNAVPVGLFPWHGSGALGLGPHTIQVTALDKNANLVTQVINVTKVPPGSVASTLTPVFKLARKATCRKAVVATCSFAGSLAPGTGGGPSLGGKVAVEWQWKNKQGRFRKLVGGLKPASKAFRFTAQLKQAGRWRVRVKYRGVAPYTSATSKFVAFRVPVCKVRKCR